MPDNQAREKKCLHQSKFYYSCALCREKLETQISDQKLVIKAAEKALNDSRGLIPVIAIFDECNDYRNDVRKSIKLIDEAISSIKALKGKYGL